MCHSDDDRRRDIRALRRAARTVISSVSLDTSDSMLFRLMEILVIVKDLEDEYADLSYDDDE